MKCPNDQTQMEKGTLIGEGGWWRGEGITSQMKEMFGKKALGAISTVAYKCSKCGKVELTTETK